MPYCTNCRTEHDPGDSFCANCGANLDGEAEEELEWEPDPEREVTATIQTGTCEKCDSEISLEANKCPQCGYEPASQGLIVSIGEALSTGALILLGGFILIIWVTAILTGYSISSAILLTAFFGFLMLFPLAIYSAAKKKS